MRSLWTWCVAGSLLIVAMAAGCGHDDGPRYGDRERRGEDPKRVRLVFVNNTTEAHVVAISVAGERRHDLGVVQARGGELRHDITIGSDSLPATVRWAAGPRSGELVITRKSPSEEVIQLGRRRADLGDARRADSDRMWDDD